VVLVWQGGVITGQRRHKAPQIPPHTNMQFFLGGDVHGTVVVDCSVEMDHGQTALEIMTSCAANSWCNMMAHGATATMEVRRVRQAWERDPGWDLFPSWTW